MSLLSQFIGGGSRPVKSLVSDVPGNPALVPASIPGTRLSIITCAVAATLYTVISVAGAGAICFFSLRQQTATLQSLRVKITLDGVVVYDQTGNATSVANNGFVVLGAVVSDGVIYRPITHKLTFNVSMLIEVASSAAGEIIRTNHVQEVF